MHIWDNFAEMHIILKMKIGIEQNETNNTISSEQFASLKNGCISSLKFNAYFKMSEWKPNRIKERKEQWRWKFYFVLHAHYGVCVCVLVGDEIQYKRSTTKMFEKYFLFCFPLRHSYVRILMIIFNSIQQTIQYVQCTLYSSSNADYFIFPSTEQESFNCLCYYLKIVNWLLKSEAFGSMTIHISFFLLHLCPLSHRLCHCDLYAHIYVCIIQNVLLIVLCIMPNDKRQNAITMQTRNSKTFYFMAKS